MTNLCIIRSLHNIYIPPHLSVDAKATINAPVLHHMGKGDIEKELEWLQEALLNRAQVISVLRAYHTIYHLILIFASLQHLIRKGLNVKGEA